MSLFPPGVGPPLPADLRSLLVFGSFPLSAPVHLSLSVLRNANSTRPITLLITPNPNLLAQSLQTYNDDWLSKHAFEGLHASLLSRIHIMSPSNAAQLALVLSEIHIVHGRVNHPPLSPDAALPVPPALIILHELSSYFIPDTNETQPWTVSSYLNIVVKALSLQGRLATPKGSENETRNSPPCLVLFDSKLETLRLPLVVNPSRPPAFGQAPSNHPTYSVVNFAKQYFQWLAIFSTESDSDTARDEPRFGLSFQSTFPTLLPTREWIWWVESQVKSPSAMSTILFHCMEKTNTVNPT